MTEHAQSSERSNWRESLPPFLLIGLALSIIGAYLVRIDPSLAPWVGAWLALLTVSLFAWYSTLRLPDSTWRKSLGVLFHIVTWILAGVALDFLLSLWRPYLYLGRIMFVLLSIALACFILLLWQRKQPQNILDRLSESKLGRFVFSSVLFGATLALLFGAYVWDRDAQRGPTSGPATPWATQLSIAQREALQRDKDALLGSIDVSASPIDDSAKDLSPANSLRTTFHYTGPQRQFSITFNDAAPTSTIEIYDDGLSASYALTLQMNEQVQQAFTQIKLSPRDAWEKTWPIAHSHADKQGKAIYPIVGLDATGFISEYHAPTWNVVYWTVPDNPDDIYGQLGAAFNLNYVARFDVDAQTGAIIEREFKEAATAP